MIKRLKEKVIRLSSRHNFNLLRELISAEFKAYDRNSFLGVFWSLLNPAITLIILYCVFVKKFGNNVEFYPLFLLIGVVTVNFFITVTTKMIGSITSNWSTVFNSTIPREDFVLADLFAHIYKFFIELSLCYLLAIYYGAFSWQSVPLVLILLIAYVGLVLGIGLLIALLHCIAMDMSHLWGIFSRFFLFITPVFYSLDHITPTFSKIIYWFNPVTPFLISFRQSFIYDKTFSILNYFYSLSLGGIFLIIGYFIFVIFENTVIEQI
jgi:ABC-2 type transport system permease protein